MSVARTAQSSRIYNQTCCQSISTNVCGLHLNLRVPCSSTLSLTTQGPSAHQYCPWMASSSWDSDYDITPADRKQYRKFLLKVKADVRIHFGSGVAHRLGHPAFAVTSLLDTELYTPQMLLVEVNRGDLDFYSDPNFDSYSEKHRMKVHFFLATVLCHEAAHWFHSYRVRELGLDWKLLTYHPRPPPPRARDRLLVDTLLLLRSTHANQPGIGPPKGNGPYPAY